VASIETGTKFPSSTTLSKLCSAFNLDVHQLFLPVEQEDTNLERYLNQGELRQQLQDEISAIIDTRFQDFLTKSK
jgi:transcriptional regulator with XRE-family HTH domain